MPARTDGALFCSNRGIKTGWSFSPTALFRSDSPYLAGLKYL